MSGPDIVEIALEFADLWDSGLTAEQKNTMLAKNVPYELLEFFNEYAEAWAETLDSFEKLPLEVRGELEKRLPSLLIIGYTIRVLQERC